MNRPQWHRLKTKPESFLLTVGKEQLASVFVMPTGRWHYTAENPLFDIPFVSTSELYGFNTLNVAKLMAFNYVKKHFKYDKRIG